MSVSSWCTCAVLLVLYMQVTTVTSVAPTQPEITSPPTSQDVLELETVEFSCIATGLDSSSEITWWTADENGSLESVIIPTENISSIETEILPDTKIMSVLTLRNVLLSYSGVIICQVENDHGVDFASATLTVFVPARILAHPSNMTVNVSDSIHMVCIAYGHPLPQLTWQSVGGNNELPAGATVSSTVKSVNDTQFVVSVFEICNLDINNIGRTTYTCATSNNVTSGLVTQTRSFSIYVQGPPVAIPETHDLICVVDEENYTISFNMTGADPPVDSNDITWMFVGADGIQDGSVFSNGIFSMDRTAFTIRKVEFHHEGVYIFTASNDAGSTNANVSLDVQGAPKKYGGVKDVVDVHQGSNVLLEYFTIADPAPTVQWFFNNQPLDVVLNTDKYNVTLTSSQPHCYVVTNSTLEIFDIQIQEIGNYTCQATNIHGNETSTFQLQLKGSCLAEQTVLPRLSNDGVDIILDWPKVEAGVNYSLPCPCGGNSSAADIGRVAYRYCKGDSTGGVAWEEPLQRACNFSSITRRLCQIKTILDDTDEAVFQVESVSSNMEGIEALDVTIIAKILDILTEDVAESQNLTLAKSFLSIVGSLLDVDPEEIRKSQAESQAATRLLDTVHQITSSLPIPENETEVVIPFDSFAVSAREVELDDFNGQMFSVALGNITDGGRIDKDALSFETQSMPTASIELPSDLVKQISYNRSNSTVIRIFHSVYLTDTLFVNRDSDKYDFIYAKVGSVIISASVAGIEKVEGVSDPPILISFAKKYPGKEKNDSMNFIGKSFDIDTLCTYWDFEGDDGYGKWSTRGCKLLSEDDNSAVCACDHLTSFALLLDVSPKAGGQNATAPVPKEIEKTLLVVSYFGAILSILLLVITIATYSSSKKLRSTQNGKLLINLCAGFLGIYVMFIVGYHSTQVDVLCAIAGGLLHYFMLATFAIMAAEAVSLYINLVAVFGWNRVKRHYILKTSLISWILPFIIVVISFAPNYKNYIGDQLCRPYGIPFYAALIGPFILVYLFNWTVFIIIIVSLIKSSRKKKKMQKDKPTSKDKSLFKRHLIISIGLSLLFGLGWGLGLPATNAIPSVPIRFILQILFIFFSGFQGVFIFIMQCARSEEARKEWARWLKILTCGKIDIKVHDRRSNAYATYNRSRSDSRFSISSMFRRRTSTATTQISNSDTLTRVVRPHYSSRTNLQRYGSESSIGSFDNLKKRGLQPHHDHYNSRTNLLRFGSESSLKLEMEDIDKRHLQTPDPEMEKNYLSVVVEDAIEEEEEEVGGDSVCDSNAAKEDVPAEVCKGMPLRNEFSNPFALEIGELSCDEIIDTVMGSKNAIEGDEEMACEF